MEPGPVAEVILQPSEVTPEIGDTQVFTVEVLDEFKNQISDALIFFKSTAEAGTIAGRGVDVPSVFLLRFIEGWKGSEIIAGF